MFHRPTSFVQISCFLSARITVAVRGSEQVVLGLVEHWTYLSFVGNFLWLNSLFVSLLLLALGEGEGDA
jgi:hypothetical protein